MTSDAERRSVLRVAPWPEDSGNPYQRLFYGALEPHGVRQVSGLSINDDALRRLAPDIDVVHLHWPEYAWRVAGPDFSSELRLVVGLARFIKLARRLGLNVWWTAHNATPHEGRRLVNYLGYRAVARQADLVIAHSPFAAEQVSRRYGARQVVVMPLGNYCGVYPTSRSRADVVRNLGLDPALPLACCIGAVRQYKGVTTAIDAVASLHGRVQLLVAGNPKPDIDAGKIEECVAMMPWARVVLRELTDQEFSDFVSASDVVLLPYLRATTSAVLVTAWTFGRGVVASNLRCFSDEIDQHPLAGAVASVGDAQALAEAIVSYLSVPAEHRSEAARAAASAREWDQCVLPLARVLRR